MTPWIATLRNRLAGLGRAGASVRMRLSSLIRRRSAPSRSTASWRATGTHPAARSPQEDDRRETGDTSPPSRQPHRGGPGASPVPPSPRKPGLRLPTLPPSRLRWRLPAVSLPGGLRPWITCLSLGFLLSALLGHGRQLLQLSLDSQGWFWLTLALGLQGVSLLVNGLAWMIILRWRGLRPRPEPVVSLYVITNLRKYLPGGIWHLASRVQVLRQPGPALSDRPASTAQSLVVTLLDPLLAAVAALALVPFGGWQNGLAVLCLLPLLLLHPRWLQPLLVRLERQRARQLGLSETLEQELAGSHAAVRAETGGYPWLPLLAELLFVLLRFAGFLCCVWAFDLQLSLDVWTWLAGFALAWTVGLVVPGAPGGLGVFEAVLLLRLAVVLPQASILAVALSYRLVVTLADVLTAALVGADQRWAMPPRSSQ